MSIENFIDEAFHIFFTLNPEIQCVFCTEHTAQFSVLFFFKYLFIYLAVLGLSCGMRDLCCRVQGLLVAAHGI